MRARQASVVLMLMRLIVRATAHAEVLGGCPRHCGRAPERPSLIEPILLLYGDRMQPRNLRDCADHTFDFIQFNLVIESCHPDRLEVRPRDEADVRALAPQARGRRSLLSDATPWDRTRFSPLDSTGGT